MDREMVSTLQALDRGMILVVLEQFGRTAPGAQAIFNRIINHRLQVLVRQGIPFSFAKRTASSELWVPSPARCSEQLGKPMRNVRPESARPTWVTHRTACRTPPGSPSEQHERVSGW